MKNSKKIRVKVADYRREHQARLESMSVTFDTIIEYDLPTTEEMEDDIETINRMFKNFI